MSVGYANGIRVMSMTHTGEPGFMLYIPIEVRGLRLPVSRQGYQFPKILQHCQSWSGVSHKSCVGFRKEGLSFLAVNAEERRHFITKNLREHRMSTFFLSIHMIAHNHLVSLVLGNKLPSSELLGHQTHTVHMHIGKALIYME